MTQETGKRPNGAAAAILAVSSPRTDARAYLKGFVCGGLAAAVTSYANVRASLSPNRHSTQSSRAF